MADSGVTPPAPAPVPPPRGGFGMFLAKTGGVVILLLLAVLIGLWGVQRYVAKRLAPDPTTIASASLAGLREQSRLSAFAARYVAVVTSRQSQLGFSTQKTLIMPGSVRYEVDLAKLGPRDVRWDAATRTLSVRLPPVQVDGPQVDLAAIREYGSGGVLATFTDAEKRLDEANTRAGQAELLRQARQPAMIRLARDATRRAVENNFSLPLRAAGGGRQGPGRLCRRTDRRHRAVGRFALAGGRARQRSLIPLSIRRRARACAITVSSSGWRSR